MIMAQRVSPLLQTKNDIVASDNQTGYAYVVWETFKIEKKGRNDPGRGL